MKTSKSAGSNAGTVAGIVAGVDERVPSNHTGFATILSLPDGTQWLGLGRNKKSAQHDAAAKCLQEVKNIILPLPEGAGLQTVGGTPGGRQNDPNLKLGNVDGANNADDGGGQICFLKKLNELHPGINEEYRVEGNHKNQIFIAFATVNGTLFEGKGRAKVGFHFDIGGTTLDYGLKKELPERVSNPNLMGRKRAY